MNKVIASAVFSAAVVLVGCNAQPVKHRVYDNILPANYAVQKSDAPMDAGVLKSRKLVLVASESFNDYSKLWAKNWETGRVDKVVAWTGLITGLNSSDYSIVAKASDPRLFSDQIVAILSQYFASVSAAPDLSTARDQGADYYGIIDFTGAWDRMGGKYVAKAGLNLFDKEMVETVAIAASVNTKRKSAGLLDIANVPMMTAATMQEGLQKNVDQIRAALTARLGSPRK